MSGKRHHFIPQFLQRGFASHNNKKEFYTWVYKRGNLNPFNANIKNVGLEGYFYAEDKESTLDDIITEAEPEYASFVEELRSNDGKQKVDNKRAASLIAHLESRTKHLRETFINSGTVFFEEVIKYLQDPSNCEKFIKNQIASKAEHIIDEELRKLEEIPEEAYPLVREQFMPMVNENIPEMAQEFRGLMAYVSKNINSLLETSAKSGHIKALLGSHPPPIKTSAYKKLYYQVVNVGELPMPLGDSTVIFHIDGGYGFKPYYEVDRKLLAVILPISSTQLLVGSSKNYQLNVSEIPLAIASCSLEYFISNQQSSENEDLAKHISETADMISEAEIQNILSDLVSTV